MRESVINRIESSQEASREVAKIHDSIDAKRYRTSVRVNPPHSKPSIVHMHS